MYRVMYLFVGIFEEVFGFFFGDRIFFFIGVWWVNFGFGSFGIVNCVECLGLKGDIFCVDGFDGLVFFVDDFFFSIGCCWKIL